MRTALLIGVCGVAAVSVVFLLSGCTPVGPIMPEPGSHGYRFYDSAIFKSFATDDRRRCIPPGWEAVDAAQTGPGWAVFSHGGGGMLVSDAFSSTTLSFSKSAYTVVLRTPVRDTPERRAEYERMVRNAFERVGALFADEHGTPRTYTVIVTAGLSGAGGEAGSIYPAPSADVGYIFLPPSHTRSEELFIHGVVHLYNEYRPDAGVYAEAQAPFLPDDWKEMEAAWAELAFESSDQMRAARREYLVNVHEAVVTKDFSRITAPPFSEATAFAKMRGKLPVPTNASYDDLDTQYGHYVLGPLILAGVDGLLLKQKTSESVETLLTKVHTGALVSFYGALRTELPESDISMLKSWIDGSAAIPEALIKAGVARYDRAR